MATVSTLGFSIISRYSGGGVRQARTDLATLRAQLAATNNDLRNHTNILGGIPSRWKAIGAAAALISPALVPIAASALSTTGALVTMAAAVGAALGAYGAAMAGAIKKTMEMAKAGKALSPTQKSFVSAVDGMKSAWDRFIKSTMNQTLAPAAAVVRGLTAGIGLLRPLLDAIHPSVMQVAKSFEAWMKGDRAKSYTALISKLAGQAMPHLVVAGKAVLNVLGDGFRAFAPLVAGLAVRIREGAQALNQWSNGGGFQRFIQYVKDNGPGVQEFWKSFRAALSNVLNILKEFAGGSLHVLTDALRAIAAINPESLKAFANAFLLLRMPIAWLVLNCPPLRDLIISLLGAMNPQIIYAVAAAFTVLKLALFAMNAGLIATPVGWVIIALAALAVAIVAIATKTTWFQTAWTYTWNFIKTVGLAIWNALQVAFHAFINAMVLVWTTVSTALTVAWNAVWNALKTAALAVWNALKFAWNAFITGIQLIWTTVSTALVVAWTAVWNAIKIAAEFVWNALKFAWNAFILGLQLIWTTVSTALVVAWTAVWNAIKIAAEFVWNALKFAWNAFIMGIQLIWTTVSTALVVAWNAVWTGISTAARAIWTGLQVAWQAFITALQTIWSAVSGALTAAWNAVWTAISTAARAIWTGMQVAWQAFINALQMIWSTVSAALSAAWNAFWNLLRTVAQAVWTALQAAWNAFWSAMTAAWNAFRTAISTAWSAFWTLLRTVAQTIWTAIRAAWQAFITAVTTAWNAFRTALSAAWSAFWTLLRTVAQTIWNAIRAAWQAFWTAVTAVWNTFRTAISTAWSAFWNLLKTVAQGVWNAIRGFWNDFIEGIKDAWNAASSWIKDKWSDTWNAVKSAAASIWNKIADVIEGAINGVCKLINALTGGFNKVAGFLGIKIEIGKLPTDLKMPRFEAGGIVEFANGGMTGKPANFTHGGTIPGYAPGRDTIPAILSKGEGVLTPEAVRGLGGSGFVNRANKTFAGHRGAGSGRRFSRKDMQDTGRDNPKHFAKGGMVGPYVPFGVGGMTADALRRAGVSLGMVSQGEYSNGKLSAGTHSGGGVVDISSTSSAVVARLRAAGFAAWARTGPAWAGNEHIHAVLMNHPALSGPARAQVASFKAGGNGLGAGGGDGGGGGGGAPSWLEPLISKAGEIISRVSQGLDIGNIFKSIFGGGGGGNGDGEKRKSEGFFGTGIGPDVGPDWTPGNDLGDAIGKGVDLAKGYLGNVMKLAIPGFGPLGKFMLGLIPDDAFEFGFKWITDKIKNFVPGAGGLNDFIIETGAKLGKGAIKYLIGKNAEKAPEKQGMFAGGGGKMGDPAQVKAQWGSLAAKALAMAGLSPSQLDRFLALMHAESGGNPGAANLWDSNAKMGQASRGLMQVIPSTFAAYRDKSLPNNILDPLANMVASARYIKARYGGNVPGSPYALGTPGATRGVHLVGEQGPELMNFAGGETVTPAKETNSILSGGAAAGAAETTMPEDLMERFRLLMTLSQQMAAIVQSSWTKVMSAGSTAKAGLTPVFTDIATAMGTTVPAAMTTMATANSATWLAMQTGTTQSWTAMRDGTFFEANDHMSVKMPEWGAAMNEAVSESWVNMGLATAAAWEGMKEGTRGPTNWIIENSYNNGLARLWNEVAAVIFEDGAKTLPTVATLAKGGPVHGPGGERADRVPAMLSRGEHVWTAREVHRAGGHHAVQAMRARVMGGDVQGASSIPAFAAGGWLGQVGNVSGGLGLPALEEMKRGSLMDQAEPFLDALDSGVKNTLAGSWFRRLGGSAGALSPSDWMRQYIEKDDELNKIGSGGPPWIEGVSNAITSWGGVTVNQRTADMLNMAIGLGASFSATQGSFNAGGVAASAGTHDGGGVVDLVPANNANVAALRAVGFAAWNRGAAWGSPSFSPHIHAVALGDPTVSPGAASQVMSYLAGRDGLAGNGPDNFGGAIPSVDGVAAIGGGGRNVDPADLEQRVVSYDRGGFLQPGYTLAYNGTGKPEPVGHHLEPKGSKGVEISMPITITGNTDAAAVVDGINRQVLPKLRQYLNRETGTNS